MTLASHSTSICRFVITAAWALLLAPPGAQAKTTVLNCTNPSSGATWDVAVDFDRHLVDSFPADITDASITWQDTLQGGIYEFDRATGALTMRNASSTGGYFVYDQCRARP